LQEDLQNIKHEYREGLEAAEKFEKALIHLFRVPKSIAKKTAKPVRKLTKTDKD
jgi:hypothetical protein